MNKIWGALQVILCCGAFGFPLEAATPLTLKSTTKFLYGEQFHAEINVPYNQTKPFLYNFLKMSLEKTHTQKKK